MGCFKSYYHLTKPGIVYGNLLSAIAGFSLAVGHYGFDWLRGAAMLGGLGLVLASACVVNNIFDRDIDASMKRTKKRALVQGEVSLRGARIFAVVLGSIGLSSLGIWSGFYPALFAFIGFVLYIGLYTLLKRVTPHAIAMGALVGAMPPIVGYASIHPQLTLEILLLASLLFIWQLPHSYAITLFRREEYKAASVPIFSEVFGPLTTVQVTRVTAWLTVLVGVALGWVLSPLMALLFGLAGVWWLTTTVQTAAQPEKWARPVFGGSLLYLLSTTALLVSTGVVTQLIRLTS